MSKCKFCEIDVSLNSANFKYFRLGLYLNLQELNTITECMRMNEEGKFCIEDLFVLFNSY